MEEGRVRERDGLDIALYLLVAGVHNMGTVGPGEQDVDGREVA